MRQYFVTEILAEGDEYAFDREISHHLSRVLRMKENTEIRIIDGSYAAFSASVFYRDGRTFALIGPREEKGAEEREITCLAALIMKDKWELIIQKACELGVTRIVPLITERTVIRLEKGESEKKVARWNKIAREACQQSNRSRIVEVTDPVRLKDIEKYKSDINLVAYENEEKVSLVEKLHEGSISFVVGPEGGISESEIEYLTSAGFERVSLGRNILRAETAVMYVLSVIDAFGGGK